jgi:3-dehydroquinate dehydratase
MSTEHILTAVSTGMITGLGVQGHVLEVEYLAKHAGTRGA